MKLLITGGHVTPALAVIDEIKEKYPNTEITFVGRKFASQADEGTTLEYKEIIARKIPFTHLSTGRLTRILSINSAIDLGKVPLGFVRALEILQKQKPDRILSFGGYIGLPIALAGSLLRIPVYTHEQTAIPGLANRIIGKVAEKVFISFSNSQKYFDIRKTRLTGNPVRKEIFKEIDKPFAIPSGRKVLYITGGSLGAHSINVHIEKILPQLLEHYVVIHQTGNIQEYNDFERLKDIRDALPLSLRENYIVKDHLLTTEVGYVYKNTDLVISRSGANTFFELAALKKPAIFIPLPWSANGEQQKHADIFKEYNTGEIFNQSQRSEELLVLINHTIANIGHYKANFSQFPKYYTQNASQTIVDFVCKN